MKGVKIEYTSDELSWIKKHKTGDRKKTHAKFCAKFNRQDVSVQNYNALCKRRGWLTGRTGCFAKGQKSWNLGRKMPFNANSARTQFKKGSAPHNTNYLGHERVNKDGYVEISIDEENPHTGFERRYQLKHKYLWENTNGKVPEGHCLKCLDGVRQNTNPANWELIDRAMLPRLSGRFGRGYENAAPELKPTILTITKLEHKAKSLLESS